MVVRLYVPVVSVCSCFSSSVDGGWTVITSSMVEPTTIIFAPEATFSSLSVLSSLTSPSVGRGQCLYVYVALRTVVGISVCACLFV